MIIYRVEKEDITDVVWNAAEGLVNGLEKTLDGVDCLIDKFLG